MKKYLIALISFSFLMSCNSGTDDKAAEAKDSTGHDMHQATTSVQMPSMHEVPAAARVFFRNLTDGQIVRSPIKIEMGVDAMSLDTANGILKPASGHHHILIGIDSISTETVIPKDSVHLHYGNAQSNAEVVLPPGKHTLTLQFADAMHRSYGSRLTSKVTVTVKQ